MRSHCASVPKWKTLALVLVVVILNAVGNLSLAWGMKHLAGAVLFNPLSYIKAMSDPFVALGIILLILVAADAHGAAELGGPQLCASVDRARLHPRGGFW